MLKHSNLSKNIIFHKIIHKNVCSVDSNMCIYSSLNKLDIPYIMFSHCQTKYELFLRHVVDTLLREILVLDAERVLGCLRADFQTRGISNFVLKYKIGV